MATGSGSTSVYEDHIMLQDLSRELFPGCQIQLLANQGACSTTFALRHTKNDEVCHRILQFRQPSFDLNMNLMAKAKLVYGAYVSSVQRHDISSLLAQHISIPPTVCYEMDVIPGVTFKSIAPVGPCLTGAEMRRQENLVRDFAGFVALGWPAKEMEQPVCDGKVGSRIPQKLRVLAEQLPYRQHRAVTQTILDKLPSLAQLPVIVNHGDTIPSNIMCDPETGRLTGVVDWAEAEYLPFGTCLYGLEHFLGRWSSSTRRDSAIGYQRFIPYDSASDLRRLFWQTLRSNVPALQADDSLMKLVVMAKTIGTLLWYGFAWDGGAIDRVITPERDMEELIYLDAFLDNARDYESLTSASLERKNSTAPALVYLHGEP
ncbi:hypothetical protein E2P81_ATG10790 [Venturia nashicola]|uniref:Aminoglycoside phosphotransferase domain-containing protein n=1 Tax=Venturia nashicola TaxID=86259 RepID=A0A4Z1P8Z6_9PEZI|nr:hypothetical protein E6O75_ATG10460 [Venturia nashicola]TLD27502.1 hypothetical protein E2P81_ATG10790 [Venturia nashicola]